MKTPRVTDFDPNPPEAEVSEAEAKPLGSPLDGMPSIVRPGAAARTSAGITTDGSTPVPPRASVPPVRGVPPNLSSRPFAGGAGTSVGASDQATYLRVSDARSRAAGAGIGAGTVPLPRRPIKQRHPFDIYADQLDSLRHLSFEERTQGGVGSMSAMVRDALDAYIATRIGGSDGGTSSSTPEEHSAPLQSMSGADASSDAGNETEARDE